MSTFDRQAVIDILSRLVTPGIKLTALADELGARKHEYAELREILFDLVEDGTVHVLAGGAFALAPRGRHNDPHGKPLPAGSTPEGGKKPPPPKKEKTKPPVQQKKSALPWTREAPPPHGRRPPQVIRGSKPREEYDPETGETRPLGTPHATEPAGEAHAKEDARIKGRITVHPAGYGFVQTEDGETVFVPAKYRATSLDGDRVAVDTWPGVRGTEGRVTEVLARGRARLTGILRRAGRAVYLEPDDPRIAADYGRVGIDDAPQGKDGDAVVIEITRYPDAARRELAGKLLKVLGDPEDPRTEIEKILACAIIPIEFPEEAIAQAVATPAQLTERDLADRIDLRERRFCTIDPETARDFDDALCIEAGPYGTRVWVAVADVAHYVRWGDALDKEATLRGVSVYLPDRVIPMLPQQLSAGICSLNPLVERCAMVVRLDYNDDAELEDVAYAAAVIKSKGRLDYPGVAAALNGDFRGRREEYRPWVQELTMLDELAQKLRVKRRARGALDLEIPEPKVILDADDPRLVRDVVKAKGDPAVKQAYQLVEEFMIAANEAVGSYFRKRDANTVWRVHAPPKQDRVEQLAELLGAYGIIVDVQQALTPNGMKIVLDQIAEKPGAQALSFLVLRTLTQAVWDTVPIGHFGLASGEYLHFTSPIRRYPDLLVHRLLKYQLVRDGQPSGGGYAKPPPGVENLQQLARDSSTHERRAMEAEREAVAMYRAYIMRDQVGTRHQGIVTAVTSFGAFVEIENPYVEGLIKLESLGNEPFEYDAVHMRLSGKKTGKMIELGDEVEVEINNVSVVRRRIDFNVVGITAVKRTNTKSRRAPEQTVDERAPRGVAQRKRAGREVERAVRQQAERSSTGAQSRGRAKSPGGGKLRLGVSHRAPGESGGGGSKKKDKGRGKKR